MGLPKLDKYQVTNHAKKRYMERINGSVTNSDEILKSFRRILHESRFMAHEPKGRQSWFYESECVVTIIDSIHYNIVTVYSSKEDYEQDRIVDVTVKNSLLEEETAPEEIPLHPKAMEILAELAKENHYKQTKHYYALLAPLYKQYGDIMDNLSRTKRTDFYDNKTKELDAVRKQIKTLVKEKNDVLKSFETLFMQENS